MNQLTTAVFFEQLERPMLLDRPTTRRFLTWLIGAQHDERLAALIPIVSRLLTRNDWLLLSASLVRGEVCIGIAQAKPSKVSQPRLSPMQRWQQQHGARR